jgi:hypothetical protein
MMKVYLVTRKINTQNGHFLRGTSTIYHDEEIALLHAKKKAINLQATFFVIESERNFHGKCHDGTQVKTEYMVNGKYSKMKEIKPRYKKSKGKRMRFHDMNNYVAIKIKGRTKKEIRSKFKEFNKMAFGVKKAFSNHNPVLRLKQHFIETNNKKEKVTEIKLHADKSINNNSCKKFWSRKLLWEKFNKLTRSLPLYEFINVLGEIFYNFVNFHLYMVYGKILDYHFIDSRCFDIYKSRCPLCNKINHSFFTGYDQKLNYEMSTLENVIHGVACCNCMDKIVNGKYD